MPASNSIPVPRPQSRPSRETPSPAEIVPQTIRSRSFGSMPRRFERLAGGGGGERGGRFARRRRCAVRECRCAARSTHRWCPPSSRDRRWSDAFPARTAGPAMMARSWTSLLSCQLRVASAIAGIALATCNDQPATTSLTRRRGMLAAISFDNLLIDPAGDQLFANADGVLIARLSDRPWQIRQ